MVTARRPSDPQPQRVRPAQVVAGFALGAVATLVAQSILFFALSGLPAFGRSPALMYASLLLPGLVGIGLLVGRRTRAAGAGLGLGLGVGILAVAAASAVLTAVVLATAR